MASNFKHLSFFFLLLVLSSVHIEARVNKFFSKFIHTDSNVPELTPSLPAVPSSAPVSAPPELAPTLAPTPAPAPAPFFDESQNAYGLYGHDSDDQFSSTSTENNPTITDVEEEILAEDAGEESYKSGYPKTNVHSNNYENPSRYNQYESNYENNSYRRNEYEPRERQGMSDTRFVENGKYYYEANAGNGENYFGGNSEREGNFKKYPNEFDSMEEFENEEYEKSEEFLP